MSAVRSSARSSLVVVIALTAVCAWAQDTKPTQPQQSSSGDDGVFVVHTADVPNPSKSGKTGEATPAPAPTGPVVRLSTQHITNEDRMALIRGLESEFVYLRRSFPMGDKGLVVKDRVVTPDGAQLRQLLAQKGAAGKPGDRAQITGIVMRDRAIVLELNGGGKKKTKWYQHISVGMGGAEQPIAPTDNVMPTGSFLTLEFDKFIPDITVDQAKQLLEPVVDFSSHSSVQSFVASLPPNVKAAIKDHKVLVGMDRDLVMMCKGRAERKIRETDQEGNPYEEWMYGQAPAEITFVRFVGDEVTQVKIMAIDGQVELRTTKEVDMQELSAQSQSARAALAGQAVEGTTPDQPQGPPQTATTDAQTAAQTERDQQQQQQSNPNRPTLTRPGETKPDATPGIDQDPNHSNRRPVGPNGQPMPGPGQQPFPGPGQPLPGSNPGGPPPQPPQ